LEREGAWLEAAELAWRKLEIRRRNVRRVLCFFSLTGVILSVMIIQEKQRRSQPLLTLRICLAGSIVKVVAANLLLGGLTVFCDPLFVLVFADKIVK
jgi:hypothetical protein